MRAIERRGALAVEPADVEVVDHLLHKVVDVLRELDVGLEVAERPELGQHLLAEAVGGGDRGGVEVGDRVRQALTTRPYLGPLALGEELRDLIRRLERRAVEEPGQLRLGAH